MKIGKWVLGFGLVLVGVEVRADTDVVVSKYAMLCEKVADIPLNNNKIFRCENAEVVCYITVPESQEQCAFKR